MARPDAARSAAARPDAVGPDAVGPDAVESAGFPTGYLFVLDGRSDLMPLAAVKHGHPEGIPGVARCWLLARYTQHRLWTLGKGSLHASNIDFYDVAQNCTARATLTSKRDQLVTSPHGLARSVPSGTLSDPGAHKRLIKFALQKLEADPKTAKASRMTRSTPDQQRPFDDTPVSPRWQLATRTFRFQSASYVLVQGVLRAHPICNKGPAPSLCRQTLQSEPAADVRLSGVLLLRLPLTRGARSSAPPELVFFKLGSEEDDTGRVELVDVIQVKGAPAPWIVLKRTTDLGASWWYELGHPGGRGWKFVRGAGESTL